VVVGIWFLVDDKVTQFLNVASDHGTRQVIWAAAVTVLIVGLITMFIGVIGCWGAFRHKTSFLSCVSIVKCFLPHVILGVCGKPKVGLVGL